MTIKNLLSLKDSRWCRNGDETAAYSQSGSVCTQSMRGEAKGWRCGESYRCRARPEKTELAKLNFSVGRENVYSR